jgi:hypothetical protein
MTFKMIWLLPASTAALIMAGCGGVPQTFRNSALPARAHCPIAVHWLLALAFPTPAS